VIKLLTPADRVAVNDASGTDSPGGGWAVPMRDVVNEAAIDRAFDTMNPVDPVSYKPALTAAYNVLQHTNVRTSAEDSYAALGADYGTMQNIARWGGGRSYQAEATLCYRVGRPAWMASWQCRRGRQQQPLHRRC